MTPKQSKEQLFLDVDINEHQENIVLALTGYLEAYPNNKISSDSLKIYAKALASLSVNQIHAAMMKILRESKFFPSISEILDEAKSITNFIQGVTIPTAGEAWQEVMQNVKRNHIYKDWVFTHPAVKKAAEGFGMYELCTFLEKDINIVRAQFMRIYEEIINREVQNQENTDTLSCLPKEIVTELNNWLTKSEMPLLTRSNKQISLSPLISSVMNKNIIYQ